METVSTMEIENFFLSKEFLLELIKVEKGEKSSEQVLEELYKKYRRD